MTTKYDTPMLRQYQEIKSQNTDSILFFRLGDFYEMFDTDAEIASKVLALTLTGRGKDENRIPMCGIPYHAADKYIPTLVSNGHKVAICEQVEDASESKGITAREVVKIITPGTLTDDSNHAHQHNFIISITEHGFSLADIGTGTFQCCSISNIEEVHGIIHKYAIKEAIVDNSLEYKWPDHVLVTPVSMPSIETANHDLCTHFNINHLSGFGLESQALSLSSAAALLTYLKQTQKNTISQLTKLIPITNKDTLYLDAGTVQNLELISQSNQSTPSLYSTLNQTKTTMGKRLLHQRILSPFQSIETINRHLDAVDELKHDLLSREEIREILNKTGDLDRLLSKVSTSSPNPRDVTSLAKSLDQISLLSSVLTISENPLLKTIHTVINDALPVMRLVIDQIQSAIIEDCPPTTRDGNFIQAGYNEELDQLNQSFSDIKSWIATLEPNEQKQTGIKTLKVGYNKVFGYYLTCPKSAIDKIPDHYIRKQTLSNAERYITPELKEKEIILLNGQSQQINIELSLYAKLIESLIPHIATLQNVSSHIAMLDVIQSFATIAQKNNYVRPIFTKEPQTLQIQNGRHPILEKHSDITFIANSIHMSHDSDLLYLITGPNMAGKSTVMKQTALIVIMAHMGGFVSAEACTLSQVDRLFTRIGAMDNLYKGQSTFMVEMLETATILNNATQDSIVILDEIGRGTATYDGLSIAGAIIDYIVTQIHARTLFATHYHELTKLNESNKRIGSYSMGIVEQENTITFTYTLQPGAANRSYGIQVGEMAGLPKAVIHRASQLLDQFESEALLTKPTVNQLSLF